jgi:hypothetical protein
VRCTWSTITGELVLTWPFGVTADDVAADLEVLLDEADAKSGRLMPADGTLRTPRRLGGRAAVGRARVRPDVLVRRW